MSGEELADQNLLQVDTYTEKLLSPVISLTIPEQFQDVVGSSESV